MNWNQPICLGCWWVRNPERKPYCLIDPEQERCCDCGRSTTEGIYIRIDPATVRFPSEED